MPVVYNPEIFWFLIGRFFVTLSQTWLKSALSAVWAGKNGELNTIVFVRHVTQKENPISLIYLQLMRKKEMHIMYPNKSY